jgi:hypothetical protein
MREYTPRRQSRRWLDADCPRGVLAIYDNPTTADRYTVFYAEPISGTRYADTHIGYRGMSEDPFHPQGVGMFGELDAHAAAAFRYRNRHRACRWSDLPERVKQCVRQDCAQSVEN